VIGGTVIETIVLPDRVWINTQEPPRARTCAIYVANTAKARCVSEGDQIWWQGQWALWTPACNRKPACGHKHHYSCSRAGVDYDIRLERIGYSGVSRPVVPVAGSPLNCFPILAPA